MSSTTLKIVTVVLVLLALILAGVSYRVFHSYAEEAQKATQDAKKQAVPQTLAVVALKPLPAYQPIERDSVGLVPVSVVPPQYFTNLDDVVNHVPLVDIDAGAPVTGRYFKEGNVLAKVIPPGFQALSIEVTDMVVRLYGSTAVVTARADVRGKELGEEFSGPYRFTRVWVRRNGHWQTVSYQATVTR